MDKSLYISGEKVWFRAYLVDAVLHKLDTNQSINVELINPLDSVVSRVKIGPNQGTLSGYILLNKNLPEGDYTLCAYAENMRNKGEEFFFKKNILVENPLSATIHTAANFRVDTGDRMTAEVSFIDIKTQKKIKQDALKIRVNDQPFAEAKIGNDTLAYFSFKLPDKSIKRVLYIKTPQCSKYITIPYLHADYEVSFYPEGGYLLEGTHCRIAFKALKSCGLPEKISGRIIDNDGHEYAKIETTHDGMGSFSLLSKEQTNYYAICKNEQGIEKRFELPKAQKGAYSIKVETIQDTLYVSVLSSQSAMEQKTLFLVLHTRGMVHYASSWDPAFKSVFFNSKKIPSGVMQIILLDGNMNPLSERLVFCHNNDQAKVVLKTDQQNYKSRQPIKTSVKVTDSKGIPLEGVFSVSVTDDNDVKPDSAATILTNLLLTSELKGHIDNPAYYFQQSNPDAKNALDLLMLTNGWRRYNIPEVIQGRYEKPLNRVKHGMEISGKVRTLVSGKPLEKGKVAMFSLEAGYYDERVTDKNGRFVFNEIECEDHTKFIVQALSKRGSDAVELLVDNDTFPRVSDLPNMVSINIEKIAEVKQMSNFIAKADLKSTYENGMKMIYLDEVEVKGKAPEKKEYSYSYYMPRNMIPGFNVITQEQLELYQPVSISDVLKYIPSTQIVESASGKKKVVIERMKHRMDREQPYNYAVLIVDDLMIGDYDIDEIDPFNIERIAVLKGTEASILGGDAAGGAVVITTKKGFVNKVISPVYNMKEVTPFGYQKPAEFYSPRYETSEQRNNGQPDLRTTIYWNPNILVSSLGESVFDFYTADASTTYTMLIEGITSEGAIIHGINRISIK
ncbi:MAG: TonB-dependent receptor plug domain-containing protein [Bacteroidia bacterium]|nr:TonB-dependent receptor plug domain-containing protein [Bacteroidia bacterium]